ncbi:MAG: UPF0280 family protein [Acidimicrobiales bacterium]
MTDPGAAIALLDDGRIHVQHGPTDLIITIDGTDEARRGAIQSVGELFGSLLADLMEDVEALRSDVASNPRVSGVTAQRMVDATAAVAGSAFLTPMAAVAGAIADTVCEAIVRDGIDRAIVNNGGDIAFYLSEGASLKVGLADVSTASPLGKFRIDSTLPIRGVATSGRGGRSLTMGIADSVAVVAPTCAVADAAATLIASAVDLPNSGLVTRVPANDMDAASDLESRPVVIGVQPLTSADANLALQRGLTVAQRLISQRAIGAAALRLQQHHATTDLSVPLLARDP